MRLFSRRGRRDAFAGVCLGLALCRAEAVSASTFRVSPVQVTLSSTAPSALLTVANDTDEPLRFQVSAFAWDQDSSGRMRLTPTQDVVFFPMMLALGPREERRIRVGSTAAPGGIEKTYRLFVEELPPAPSGSPGSEGFQVRVLTKLGLPVFVQPKAPLPTASVELRGVSGDHVRYAIRNTGNAHLMLQSVRVKGLGAEGESLLDRQADGWYLLAGGEREYEQPLASGACAALASVAIEAETDRGLVTRRFDMPPGLCDTIAASAASTTPE